MPPKELILTMQALGLCLSSGIAAWLYKIVLMILVVGLNRLG